MVTFDTPGVGAAPIARGVNTVTIGRRWNSANNTLAESDDYAFAPKRLQVPVGTTLTWINDGEQEHTATAQGGVWDTGILRVGESAEITYSAPGEYVFYCLPHPWMSGQLIVK
jgi:plastocyanin